MQNNTKEKDSTIQQTSSNLLSILESIDNIDIAGQEWQQVARVIKSLQDLLEQVKSKAHDESKQRARVLICELTDEKESLLQRLSEAPGAKNIEHSF